MADDSQRIASVTLEGQGVVRYAPDVERERTVAIYDLVEDNRFRPLPVEGAPGPAGPYDLHLETRENRLILNIRCADGAPLAPVTVPLAPFRRTVRDYFTICESYYQAIRSASPSQIEALDMGRRALHDEAADELTGVLAPRVEIDRVTARRLFTLICVLHIRGQGR